MYDTERLSKEVKKRKNRSKRRRRRLSGSREGSEINGERDEKVCQCRAGGAKAGLPTPPPTHAARHSPAFQFRYPLHGDPLELSFVPWALIPDFRSFSRFPFVSLRANRLVGFWVAVPCMKRLTTRLEQGILLVRQRTGPGARPGLGLSDPNILFPQDPSFYSSLLWESRHSIQE